PPLASSSGGLQPPCVTLGRAQLEGTSRLPARELDRLAKARLHARRLSMLPCKQLGAQPMQLGLEHALVGGYAERLVDCRGGLLDRAGGGIRLRQPADVEPGGDPLAGGAVHAEPLAELGDGLVVPAVPREGGAADDRGQAREQRESMLGREGDQRLHVFERAPWLPQENVERA